jgi:predicted Zn-dependent protease
MTEHMTGETAAGTARGADRPHEIVERALELSGADETVVIAEEQSSANLRWAANSLTTNGVTRGRRLTVIAAVNGAQGTATGVVSRTGVTNAELEPLVRAAGQAARQSAPVEDARPLPAGDVPPTPAFTEPPLETSAKVFGAFAPALGETFAAARAEGRDLFGFANHELTSTFLGTSTGLRLRHDQPTGSVTVNAKSPDRSRSAWAGLATDDFTDVDMVALDRELARRLRWAERSVKLPAGRYETLLPPTSVADLLVYLYWTSDARQAAEGRTVFSAPGGVTRIGDQLSQLPFTLYSDPAEPRLTTTPFAVTHSAGGFMAASPVRSVFDNGLPLAREEWISDGVLRRLPTTRHTAELTGLPLASPPANLILDAGGGRSLEEMIAATERGLLITSLWYIREVDPKNLLLTGLTRDGVYLVENGEVTGVVNNFRFNESPVDLLARATEAGRTERCVSREWGDYFPGTAMPALRVPDFHMSSVSPGV